MADRRPYGPGGRAEARLFVTLVFSVAALLVAGVSSAAATSGTSHSSTSHSSTSMRGATVPAVVRAGTTTTTTVDPAGGVAWSDRPQPPAQDLVPRTSSVLGVLRVTLVLPPTVRSGGTMQYVVAVANPTDGAVSLTPCPGYQETIATTRAVVSPSYILNCASIPEVGAHHTVRFRMRIPVPQVARTQTAAVDWIVLDPSDINATGTVTIEGSD